MKRLLKFNQLSWKMKLAVSISALWLLYWIFTGFREQAVFWGLVFGGFPLFVIWGSWMIATGPRKNKEAAMAENIVAQQKVGFEERRKYERLVYPPARRPSLKFDQYELQIINISERGLKLSNTEKITFDEIADGEAVLLSGKQIKVKGKVAWSLNKEFGMLMDAIPKSIINEEKRILSSEPASQ